MELIQNILVTALLGIWACLSIGFFVWLVQGISNDHKREKREKEQASRDMEYHEKAHEGIEVTPDGSVGGRN